MAPPDKEEDGDESMENILHSIKQIIAEDGDEETPEDDKKKKAEPEEDGKAEKKAKKPDDEKEEDIPGSDVLELTEVVEDEEPAAKGASEEKAEDDKDVLSQIDDAVGASEETHGDFTGKTPAEVQEGSSTGTLPEESASAAPGDPSLLSDEARAAAAASVDKLKKSTEPPPLVTTDFPEFVSGHTLEAIVSSMLRPMIKEWLDENLPAIVERVVEQEIKRITK